MEKATCAPTVSDSPISSNTDVNDAASIYNLPSPDQELRMFTRYEHSSSTRPSVSTLQPEQQLENESSHHTRPSIPLSVMNKPNEDQLSSSKRSTRRTALWKTIGTILGFFLTAIFAALGHYMLVIHLNGHPVDTSVLTQTQVSAVSVLLSTIFRAALTASMGACFAQHLWHLLRGPAMSLSTVEMLFVIRTNIFALLRPHGICRAPLLFLIAHLTWGLGIATIYPAGALTVVFNAQKFTENYNMSVMNPPVPANLDFLKSNSFSTLCGGRLQTEAEAVALPLSDNSTISDGGSEYRVWFYEGPAPELGYLAQAIISNNQVFTLPGHPGENATYNLQFRGPYLRCTASQYNSTLLLNHEPRYPSTQVPTLVSAWDQEQLTYTLEQNDVKGVTAQRHMNNSVVWNADSVTKKQICEAESALYNITVTFPRGVQTVNYSLSDVQPLAKKRDLYDVADISGRADFTGGDYGVQLALPPETDALQIWYRKLSKALPISNEWAIIDSLMTLVEGECFQDTGLPSHAAPPSDDLYLWFTHDLNCPQREGSSGDTITYDCGAHGGLQMCQPEGLLSGTIFHTARFDRITPVWDGVQYDPRAALNLSEAMLNEALANITISAISLGTWWDMVPVTTTRYRSTYLLSNPLNLILPYSICLAAATIFVAIAIWSLWHNRAPAADGGFLQIMMATVGDTKMSRAILREQVAAIDDMSDELKSLKIRYGELVEEDKFDVGNRRFGFGTTDEINSLRKRR